MSARVVQRTVYVRVSVFLPLPVLYIVSCRSAEKEDLETCHTSGAWQL